jgi:hypothetical protein
MHVTGETNAHTPNESYQNFPNRGVDDCQQQYYVESHHRLVRVKHT